MRVSNICQKDDTGGLECSVVLFMPGMAEIYLVIYVKCLVLFCLYTNTDSLELRDRYGKSKVNMS